MKISIIRSLVSAVAAITCVTGFLVVSSPVSAQKPVVTAAQKSSFSVSVTVPAGGDPVTYVLNGKSVTVKAGESSSIPANAKEIKLPAGTKITVATTPDGATSPSANTYNVGSDITLSKISAKVLKGNNSAFTLVSQTGDIKLPSGDMTDLINEIALVSGQGQQVSGTPAVSDAND